MDNGKYSPGTMWREGCDCPLKWSLGVPTGSCDHPNDIWVMGNNGEWRKIT